MSLVKWVNANDLVSADRAKVLSCVTVPVILLADLKELVEMLRTNIAHSVINTDEISAYRLACEHILARLAPEGE